MTEHEYQSLLDLANSWQKTSEVFKQAKINHRKLADAAQRRNDFVERDLHSTHAAEAEIRSEVLAGTARKLALLLGKLYQPQVSPQKATA